MAHTLTGVNWIMATPFGRDGGIDEGSLRRLVDFGVEAGLNGLVILGVMGEAHRLTESERMQVIGTVIEEAGDRVPVSVGTGQPGTDLTVHLSRMAQDAGASAVLVTPPPMPKPDPDALLAYYERVAQSVEIPVIVQDFPAGSGVFMPASLLARLSQEIEGVRYLKLEDPPTPVKVARVVRLAGDGLKVFGGLGGVFFLEELLRGAAGTMTGFAYPEVLVAVYRHFAGGERERATEVFFGALPLIRYESQPGIALSLRKETLKRRGLIEDARVRHPGAPIDAAAREELFALIDRVDPEGNG